MKHPIPAEALKESVAIVGRAKSIEALRAHAAGRRLPPASKRNNAPDNLALTNRSEHARIHFEGTKQSAEHIRKRVESTRKTKAAKVGKT